MDNMQYTEDQLMRMPMKLLKGLDIMNGEDEKMVQKVLNTRLKDMPVANPMNFSSSVTDNMTIEKERELQAKIDARNARIKASLSSEDEPDEETTPVEEETPLMPETEEDPTTDPVPETIPPLDSVGTSAKFCDYCDSKHPTLHKKACTRPGKVV